MFFYKIEQWCKTAVFSNFQGTLTAKNAWKGPKYAKFTKIGDIVYSKGLDIDCET
jgi:hypothetical protein